VFLGTRVPPSTAVGNILFSSFSASPAHTPKKDRLPAWSDRAVRALGGDRRTFRTRSGDPQEYPSAAVDPFEIHPEFIASCSNMAVDGRNKGGELTSKDHELTCVDTQPKEL
jgi:hypothetical protein